MPVCVICLADGVVCVNDAWYCVAHIDDAFFQLGRLSANILGWDEEQTIADLSDWLGHVDDE